MVAPTLVKITLYDPNVDGDTSVPFVGRAGLKPSLVRHIEGETPPDYVVTTKRFYVTFGDAYGGNPATPGVAWVYLEPTDYGPYADAWVWEFTFYRNHNPKCVRDLTGSYFVPTSGGVVDFGDLTPLDPNNPPVLPPVWQTQINSIVGEIGDLHAEDVNLQNQIDALAASGVQTVNGVQGDVVVSLVETPPGSLFYDIQVVQV